ncbi:FAD-dependent oxidoreductase [Noviherbaspirillum massiliense]|uniref:FAD-dependent oxidoreductase n=1 Tax=Noviherbaspirillum massiliense TaxID=1465823 RepID=UPI0003064F78|nr:FAD-dependent oxidoreductase [Noviherbaspirillum massiliense]
MKPVIIIGSGQAGYTVAREFRKLDKTTPMFIITADDGGFYAKPMLSNAFAQNKQPDQLVNQTALQIAVQLDAHIMTGTRATGIDTKDQLVATSAGSFAYGKLVIAVGAQPIRLAIDGDAASEVLSINHIADYAHFRSRLTGQSRVTILGAGLIGCEFADDLAGAGHAVTLVDPGPLPLSSLAAPALAQGLRHALEDRGVAMHLGTTAARIDRNTGGIRVALADGSVLETDIVLSAVRLRPDLRVAQQAGLSTNRGILIDAFGRTSAANVYALGDCAEYTLHGETRPMPYIAPLMAAARAIARALAGEHTAIELKPSPVIVKTPSFPLALLPPPPHALASGYWETSLEEERMICRFYDPREVMTGFGLAPQEATLRQELLAALGKPRISDLQNPQTLAA